MEKTHTSPAELVLRLQIGSVTSPELLLLTGDSGAGKTTWCQELVRQARALGIEPLGLISPAVFEQGGKTGIDLLNIANGEHRRLAVRCESSSHAPSQHPMIAKMNWLIDSQVIAWGNQVLAALTPSQLLILDEIGPLELIDDSGLTNGMSLVAEKSSQITCVVVRPSLLLTALDRWPWAKVMWVADAPEGVNLP